MVLPLVWKRFGRIAGRRSAVCMLKTPGTQQSGLWETGSGRSATRMSLCSPHGWVHGESRIGLPQTANAPILLFNMQAALHLRAMLSTVTFSDLQPSLQTGLDEFIQIAIEDGVRVRAFHAGAQILDAGLIQHVGTDLAAPADIRLGVFECLLFGVLFLDFELVQFCSQLF